MIGQIIEVNIFFILDSLFSILFPYASYLRHSYHDQNS